MVLFQKPPVEDSARSQIPACRSRSRIERPEKVAPLPQHQHLRVESSASQPQRIFLRESPAADDTPANALRYRSHRQTSAAADPVRLPKHPRLAPNSPP